MTKPLAQILIGPLKGARRIFTPTLPRDARILAGWPIHIRWDSFQAKWVGAPDRIISHVWVQIGTTTRPEGVLL